MLNGAAPAFDVQGGLALALMRGLSVAALLSVFGALVFRALVAPRALGRMEAGAALPVERGLVSLIRASLACAIATLLGWLVLQSGAISGAEGIGPTIAAAPTVLRATQFGHLVALQLAVLVLLGLAMRARARDRHPRAILALAIVAVALQAGHSHAMAMDEGPSGLLAMDILHLIGAGAWLGGLAPLLVVVRMTPAKIGATAARWFSPLGKWCIALLTVSALWQGWVLVGGVPGLVGTAYGWMVIAKIALSGVLLAFAATNRYRLAPALLGADPARAKRLLTGSIALQTGFGLLIVLVASVLSSLPPGMHAQPVWPFTQRFSLDAVREDAGFRREVIQAALALAGAAALLVLAALIRRRLVRLIATAAAAVITWFAIQHFDLLLVDAYPTSYVHSPTGFAAESIMRGAALFPQDCAVCHGASGRGDGPAAASLPVPPADLTAAHLWMHDDGELAWWLSHGIAAPDGGPAMPGFAGVLSEEDRWALIDYIRARNAGLVASGTGHWSPPVQAPGLRATCADGRTIGPGDPRGEMIRLVIGAPPPDLVTPDLAPVAHLTTVLATPDPSIRPEGTFCVTNDEMVAGAYAIVSGIAPDGLVGTQFLMDGGGWLRAIQRPGDTPGWNDPATLAAAAREARDHPIAAAPAMNMPM